MFDQLKDTFMFSKIDLKSGYHQVMVVKRDVSKIIFLTRYGYDELVVMPFGLTNALTIFMDLINRMFQDCLNKFIIVFIDDISMYSRTCEEHGQYMKFALQRLY